MDAYLARQDWAQLFDLPLHFLAVTDFDGRFQWLNRAWEATLGYSAAELLGTPFIDLVHPDDRPATLAEVAKLTAGASVSRFENRYVGKDGQDYWLVWAAVPDLAQRRIYGLGMDLTEHRQAAAALRQNEQFLRDVFEAIQDGISVLDRTLTIRRVNRWMESMYPQAVPLIGRKCYEAYQQRDTVCPWCPTVKALQTGQPHNGVVPHSATGRPEGWVDLWAFPLKDAAGQIQGVIEYVRDITAQKRGEIALRESEARFRLLVETAPSVILGLAPDGRITEFNPEAERIYGRTRADVLGKNYYELLLPPDIRAHVMQDVARVLAGTPTRSFENPIVAHDGDERVLMWSVDRLPKSGGEPTGIIAVGQDVTDRKRAEEALRESEQRLHAILQGSSIPTFVIDRDHRVIHWNRALEVLSGIPAAEMLGTTRQWRAFYRAERPCLADLLVDGPAGKLARLYGDKCSRSKLIAEAYEATDFFPDIGPGGRWLRFTAAPIRDSAGQLVGAAETLEDITARRQAEAGLRASEERYRTLFDGVPVGLFRTTPAGEILDANTAMVQMFGFVSREALLARGSADLWADMSAREKWQALMARDGLVQGFEGPGRCCDGSVIEVRLNSRQVCDADGRVLYYEGSLEDVTERKRAERALQFQAMLLDQIRDRITATDLEGRIVYVNQAECDGLQRSREELIGSPVAEYRDAAHGGTQHEILETTRTQGAWRGELVHRARDGREVIVDYRTWLVRDERGQPAALCGVGTDITERRRAEAERERLEAQLRQSQKLQAVGQLAGGIAHDFNNILTTILGSVELAQDAIESGGGTSTSVLQALRQIERNAQRAANLTRQLLTFSRRQTAQPQLVDLNRVLAGVEPMLRRLLTENIAMTIAPAAGPAMVRVDLVQIEQVVLNLVVNARDAMPDGGQLIVETAQEFFDEASPAAQAPPLHGRYVVLIVSDTGCGMDAGTRERIFEPFFTTKPPGQGTGLGLATVYGIVSQAAGHIHVYSEPGHGSTFRVYLPAAVEPAAAQFGHDETPPAETGSETILLCEDDEGVRELGQRILTEAGYHVLPAAAGAEARRLAAQATAPIDLLLTDVVLPDTNGCELSAFLTLARPQLGTLYVSGHTAGIVAHHGVLETGVEFLAKPFSRASLLRRVREVLDKRAARCQ